MRGSASEPPKGVAHLKYPTSRYSEVATLLNTDVPRQRTPMEDFSHVGDLDITVLVEPILG